MAKLATAVVLINSPFMKRAVSAFQNNGTTLNEFIKNEVNGEVKELSEVSDIDISKVSDGSQDVAIRNLFYNFNKYNSPSWTLRKLINLESFIPETHTEQKQLLKDIVSLMKNRNINVTGLVTAKSTYARCGLGTPPTVLEAGWHGNLVLEFSNHTSNSIRLYANSGAAQILFFQGEEPEISYADRKGKYQGQTGITLAKSK